MRVGVTGSDGFLGWHLRCRLGLAGHEVLGANRATFADTALLDAFVADSDVIVHTAGVNRNSELDEVVANAAIAEQLVDAIERVGSDAPVIYTNSVHASGDTEYGRAKRRAGEAIAARRGGGVRTVDLVLPHLFGEYGLPFYNSAVHTFAYQLANGQSPEINGNGRLELLHAQEVAADVLGLIDSDVSGTRRLTGTEITVPEAWALLERMHQRYVNESTIPACASLFELRMFNTLRSQLYLAGHYPRAITLHADARGAFSELCRADGLGQTSISTTVPGVTRGDHFHLDKVERFVVVSGQATIRLRRILTGEVSVYEVGGDAPAIVDMPPLTTHNITNTGDDIMTTVFWAGDHFDPANPDTYIDPVEAV